MRGFLACGVGIAIRAERRGERAVARVLVCEATNEGGAGASADAVESLELAPNAGGAKADQPPEDSVCEVSLPAGAWGSALGPLAASDSGVSSGGSEGRSGIAGVDDASSFAPAPAVGLCSGSFSGLLSSLLRPNGPALPSFQLIDLTIRRRWAK